VDHLADDGNPSLFANDVIVGRNVEVMIEGVAQSHSDHWTNSFTVTIEIVPERKAIKMLQLHYRHRCTQFENPGGGFKRLLPNLGVGPKVYRGCEFFLGEGTFSWVLKP
jgi:hypothetical protein